ncbi:MAG: DinB family protein [Terracidiphilus sp.]
MNFQLEQGIEILEQTPAVLDSLLREKSVAWLNARRAPASFSALDVLGHLIHGEKTDWIPRIRIILEHQDTKTFEPFDRFAFQDWIAGKTVVELLDEFAKLRRGSLETLEGFNLTEEQFALPGMHPELGAVTLGNHLANWAVHDLGHIAQIVKTMAWEYRDATGPWRVYTSILD